jgi:hypothetical protein
MSLALTRKILETMQVWGWLQPGACVIDCFGGRGTTAAVWCAMDPANRAVTVELEPHFVAMQEANKAHAEKRLRRALHWEALRGDSRELPALMAGDFSSTRAQVAAERAALEAVWRQDWRAVAFQPFAAWGDGEPGYAAAVGKPWVFAEWPDREPLLAARGAACCTSPPYSEALTGGGIMVRGLDKPGGKQSPAACDLAPRQYVKTATPGNLGNLPDREPAAAVTSPPFEDSVNANAAANDVAARVVRKQMAGIDVTRAVHRGGPNSVQNRPQVYGKTNGQIGATEGETYASAVEAVYRGLAAAGVRYLAVVVKNPTRNGKLRRLDQLTARLLRAAGYKIHAWRRAMLVEGQGEQEQRHGQVSLFGEEVAPSKKLVGRLSFFRRLHAAKGGVFARWEDVFLCELDGGGEGAAVTSPPYGDQQGGGPVDFAGGYVPRGLGQSIFNHRAQYASEGQIGNLRDGGD